MAGPATRLLDGEPTAWTGHARHVVAVTPSDATIYDPPLRALYVHVGGTVVLVLDGDDETDSSKYLTRTCAADTELTIYAIRQVRAASSASSITGAR